MNPNLFWRIVSAVVRTITKGGDREQQRNTANRAHVRDTGNPIIQADERRVNTTAVQSERRGRDLSREIGRAPRPGRPTSSGGARPAVPPADVEYNYETIVVWRDGEGVTHRTPVIVVSAGRPLSAADIDARSRDAMLGEPSFRDRVSADVDTVVAAISRVIIVAEYAIPKA